MGRVTSALKAEIALIDLHFRRGEMFLHCVRKRLLPHACRIYLMRARDVDDPAVTKRYKMPDSLVDPDGVVKNDVAHLVTDNAKIVKNDTCFLMLEFVDK